MEYNTKNQDAKIARRRNKHQETKMPKKQQEASFQRIIKFQITKKHQALFRIISGGFGAFFKAL